MPRSVPVVLAVLLALALTLTACDGGVHGTPGGSGVHDPYFPRAGNGGYDVGHYDLKLAYDPAGAHRLTGTATLTAIAPENRFGHLEIDGHRVRRFQEKPQSENEFVNGGYFVLNRRIRDYLTGDTCVLEKEPLARLAAEGQLFAYEHRGFWQCMDNYREYELLNRLWDSGRAPWKVW